MPPVVLLDRIMELSRIISHHKWLFHLFHLISKAILEHFQHLLANVSLSVSVLILFRLASGICTWFDFPFVITFPSTFLSAGKQSLN